MQLQNAQFQWCMNNRAALFKRNSYMVGKIETRFDALLEQRCWLYIPNVSWFRIFLGLGFITFYT